MASTTTSHDTSGELRNQWTNPGDIFSLLQLIGGDIVQKAMAQLVGKHVKLTEKGHKFGITPVAFSFGWVAYMFVSLMSAVGDHQLMPTPDLPCIVVNGENGFVTNNKSWILSRILRDHESANEVDPAIVSIRIDVFDQQPIRSADIDFVWVLGWSIMIVQIILSIIPWIVYGDWAIFLITICGTVLALVAGALPQWQMEKWAGRPLGVGKKKVTCLMRGNGSSHIMVLLGDSGSWDVESLAGAKTKQRKGTVLVTVILAVLWTALLISASGLKEHSWFLVGVGGIGMLQNLYAAGTHRAARTSKFHLTKRGPRSTIIASRKKVEDVGDSDDDVKDTSTDWLTPLPKGEIVNVMGALMELEKDVPEAGLALLKVFFPGGLRYKRERIKYKLQRRFWKKAFRSADTRASTTKAQTATV
ncbi:hypothetical protein N431DRAFT_476055 [Stipitochalara longipes BDJ]|nr:hypothetical protein N431DRAFT_476055 [Stipitochalara longipes BDJ]